MKKALLLGTCVLLALGSAQLARADTFTDPGGDSGAAPDVTAITAVNDPTGTNLTFTVRTNQAAIAADAGLFLVFDVDQSPDTGVELLLVVGSGGWELLRWDGSQFVAANASSANATYANGLLTFKISKADLGNVETFSFFASSAQFDAQGNILAEDAAPDGDAVYEYTIKKPVTLRAGTTTAAPAAPKAGSTLVVRTRITRGDTGGPLASGTATCTVRIGTVAIRATGRVAGGVASCTMKIPKTAKGKTVRVTTKVTFQGVTVTKTVSYRIR